MALGICLKKVMCLFAELRPKIQGKCCLWLCHKRQQSSGWTGGVWVEAIQTCIQMFSFFYFADSRFFHASMKRCTMQHIYYGTNWNLPRNPTTCHIIPYYNLGIISIVIESLLLRVCASTDSQDRPRHRFMMVKNISQVLFLSSRLSALPEHSVSHKSHSGCSAWFFN